MEFNAIVDISNAFSLTDFQRNAKEFIDVLGRDRRPILLTVNGRVAAVLADPSTYQELVARAMDGGDEVPSVGRETE